VGKWNETVSEFLQDTLYVIWWSVLSSSDITCCHAFNRNGHVVKGSDRTHLSPLARM